MTNEPWNTHTPGDPMPCKCGDSVVEVRLRDNFTASPVRARYYNWGRNHKFPDYEITTWRFIERKGDDMIADPYDALEWYKDDTAIVPLKELGRPEWVRDDDLVRFRPDQRFDQARTWILTWKTSLSFQIKRRPVLTPAEPQLLAVLSVATDDEADAILSAARRANIEVPE